MSKKSGLTQLFSFSQQPVETCHSAKINVDIVLGIRIRRPHAICGSTALVASYLFLSSTEGCGRRHGCGQREVLTLFIYSSYNFT